MKILRRGGELRVQQSYSREREREGVREGDKEYEEKEREYKE